MKKFQTIFILAFAFILSFNAVMANSPRMVLVEKFTNASCAPCAASAPTFHAWAEENFSKIIPVEYHVSFPGRDIMYNDNPTPPDQRVNVYYGPAQGVPHARVNGGTNIHIAQTATLSQAVAAAQGTSPYDITVTHKFEGQTFKVDVTVASSQVVPGNTKLRVAILEYVRTYGAGIAGTNGQTEFHWVVRDMLPTPTGTDISLGAGQNTTKSFSTAPKSYWTNDKMYVVAWLQNDNTKEVYQAGTSLKAISIPLEVQNKYIKLDQAPGTTDVVLTNSGNVDANVTVEIDEESSIIPSGWTTSLNKTSLFIAKGTSQTVTFTITPNANKGFASVIIKSNAVAEDYISQPASGTVYAMSNGVEKVMFIGGASYLSTYATDIMSHNLASGIVLPFIESGVLSNFDFSAVKVVVLPIDFAGRALLAVNDPINTALFGIITNVMNNKGKVLILDEMSMFIAFTNEGTPQAQSFFQNNFGVKASGSYIQLLNNQGQLSGVQVLGVSGDTITNGMDYTLNIDYPTTRAYSPYAQILQVTNPATTSVIFNYVTTNGNVPAAVKVNKAGAKAVYIGFGIQSLLPNYRYDIIRKSMDWLALEPIAKKPVIAANKTTYDFGEVETGKVKSETIVITNNGNADLTVTGVNFYFNTDNSFYSNNLPTFPRTITPGKTMVFTVNFSPKSVQDYSTSGMEIMSNDPDNGTLDLPFKAIGIQGSSVYENANTAEFAMQAQPSEFEETSTLSLNIGGDQVQNVEITMIDVAGNTVMTLANGSFAPGAHTVNINAANLASGKYFVIAKSGSKYYQTSVVIK